VTSEALQDRYYATGIRFGCGPSNQQGLRIKSVVRGDEVVAVWHAAKHHEALDTVSSPAASRERCSTVTRTGPRRILMRRANAETPPATVTAEFAVKLARPTPTGGPIELVARPVELANDRAVIEAELRAGGKVCATFRGTFVAAKPGHPAYHRW